MQVSSRQSTDSKLPKFEDHIPIGNFVYLDGWRIGKVLQFANYKEWLKKTHNSKTTQLAFNHLLEQSIHGTTTTIIYLCMLPIIMLATSHFMTHKYVATLFSSCFEAIKRTRIKET